MTDEPPASRALRLEAPAKLNLSLAVTGRRADGLHELAGVMVLLELADELVLAPGAGDFRLSGEAMDYVPAQAAQNLAWRGLLSGLSADVGRWLLSLRKRIRAQAGLGGGSSDAAAAWRLGRVASGCDDRPSAEQLGELSTVGADVPFFAAQTAAARVSGIGEHVEPLLLPASTPREVVLIHSPFGLSTAAVFAELRPGDWSSEAASPVDVGSALESRNDLLAPARRLRPELDDLQRLVLSAGAEPHMTGSGPTLFVLVDDPQRADAVAHRLERAGLAATRTRIRAEAASIGQEEVSA
jgi:4-diphosphocytidyl-2-C-methyl-D-erythritol kinase